MFKKTSFALCGLFLLITPLMGILQAPTFAIICSASWSILFFIAFIGEYIIDKLKEPEQPVDPYEEKWHGDEVGATNYANSATTQDAMYKEEWAARKAGFIMGCKFKEEQIRGKQK